MIPNQYDAATVSNYILSNPDATPGDNLVRLLFAPGLHEIDRIEKPSGTPATRELILEAQNPIDRPVLKLNVPTGNPGDGGAKPNHLFNGPAWQTWMLYFVEGPALTRFEAHNLILDANWPEWALSNTGANPAYVSGFALGALYARARKGWIENVHIRNCGANGITPCPYWSGSGRECFPLFLYATDFIEGMGPNGETLFNAWIVEDCEVSDFHSVHGGYGTLIMPMVRPTAGYNPDNYPDHRPFVVRRCQIRGNRHTFAFGSAGYGPETAGAGVAFSDNVVLNAARGLNHDTGIMRNFDYSHSVLLDVGGGQHRRRGLGEDWVRQLHDPR